MPAANDNGSSRGIAPSDHADILLLVGERAYEVALCVNDELVLFDAPDDQAPCDAEVLLVWGSRQIRMLVHLVEGMSSASQVVRVGKRAGG